jgi:hypothetical protein
LQHVDVRQHRRPVLHRNPRIARGDAGGDHHLVEPAQIGGRGLLTPSRKVMPGCAQHRGEPVDEAVKLFLPRHLLGQVQLAANLFRLVEQGDRMPPFAATLAVIIPAGPAPTTATRLGRAAGA